MRGRVAGSARLVVWLGVLLAVLAGMTELGRGPLAAPPLREPGAWEAWLAGRRPVDAAFALLRLAVLAAGWYLLAATVVAVAGRAVGAVRLARIGERLGGPLVRRAVHGAVGVGLAAAVATASLPPRPAPAAAAPVEEVDPGLGATLRRLALEPAPPAAPAAAPGEGATLRRLPSEGPLPGTGGPSPAPAGDRWEVRPGDHLWSIAARTLALAWGRAPSDGEVAPYWRALVERNRAGLPDPANPDLLHPGHVLELPPPPAVR